MKIIRNIKNKKAITLIALVITIVVLIILAGVAISLTLGNNGLFNKAKEAKEKYQNATQYEEEQIARLTNKVDAYAALTRGGFSAKDELLLTDEVDTRNVDSITLKSSVYNYDFIIISGYSNTEFNTSTIYYAESLRSHTLSNNNLTSNALYIYNPGGDTVGFLFQMTSDNVMTLSYKSCNGSHWGNNYATYGIIIDSIIGIKF